MMAKDFPEIKHQFDPWHWVKVIYLVYLILDFEECLRTNLVPDCKPPRIGAKPRTTAGKV